MVSLVMCALLGGMFAFARSSYLDAYDGALRSSCSSTAILIGYGHVADVGRPAGNVPTAGPFLTLRPGDS